MSNGKGFGRKAAFAAAIVVAFAMTALVPQASAQEISDEHLEAARQAIEASGSTERLDNILPQMGEQAKQQLIVTRPDAAEQINGIVDEATLSLAARRGALENEIALVYARIFTIEELETLTEFYRSEAGQKLIRETPVVARSIQDAARVWSQGVQRDLQQEVQKKLEAAGL